MAKVIPIGEPVNDAERQAIALLRDHLPDSYLVLHNFDVVRDGLHTRPQPWHRVLRPRRSRCAA
jgi:hypothetical protein